MARGMRLGGVVLAVVVVAWLSRERLGAALVAPAPAAHPAAPVDVLYSWVDEQGVTHYEQDAAEGRRLQYDGSRITPLAPVVPGLAGRIREAVGDDASRTAASAGAGPGDAEAAPLRGSTTLQGLRAEMEANARQMQQARAARRDL